MILMCRLRGIPSVDVACNCCLVIPARRRAASRKVKQMKQCSKDTEDLENEDNEDLFADIGQDNLC